MYLIQKIVITIFGLGLALFAVLSMGSFYSGESVPLTSRVVLAGGGVEIVRTAVNLLGLLLVGMVVFVWATPLKKQV